MNDIVIENQNKYRLAWADKDNGEIKKGSFQFNDPAEAEVALRETRKMFPCYTVWLEDREGNEIVAGINQNYGS